MSPADSVFLLGESGSIRCTWADWSCCNPRTAPTPATSAACSTLRWRGAR
ncbi:hypothetical protein GS534_27235 [Rhodococcus hoagii]|nr:hypothetical protein [Prescottella equi]